jgi:Tol biopolymer transport system component
MRADGTAQRQLTDLSIRAGPEVSPDGHWLIFAADGVIYRMRSDGQNLSLITDSAWVLGLQWSPDGAWILYRVRAENLTSTLYLIRPDGTDQRLIAPPEEYAGDAQWSPDGQWIVFSANRSRMIYRIRPDGTDVQELTLTTDKSRSPQWSPDGERILYTDSEGLFWMRPDGSEPQLIAPSADAATVSWSPPIGLGWHPWRSIAAGIGLISLAIFPWRRLRILAGNPVGSR